MGKRMSMDARRWLLFAILMCIPSGRLCSRQNNATSGGRVGTILLDVVATEKSGLPVSGLTQQDFTVLDNKKPQTITSFRAVDGRQASIEVVLVLDAVNTEYRNVAVARQLIDKFLRTDGGRLAHPTRLAVFSDSGMQFQEDFSEDGYAISNTLDQRTIAMRDIGRASQAGALEHFQASLHGLWELIAQEERRTGRKLILWVSPGWPLFSEGQAVLDAKQELEFFGNIVNISTRLREGRITLYSIDPLGTTDIGLRTSDWKAFLKGVSKPGQVELGDLALEVIATQSGGRALNSSNDVAAELQECLSDMATYYEISFDPPTSDKPNEYYHHLEVRVGKRGLTARTRQGYYLPP